MHYDHYNMIVIRGRSQESVECTAGYLHYDMEKMEHYKNKYDMVEALIRESNAVKDQQAPEMKREETGDNKMSIFQQMWISKQEIKEDNVKDLHNICSPETWPSASPPMRSARPFCNLAVIGKQIGLRPIHDKLRRRAIERELFLLDNR